MLTEQTKALNMVIGASIREMFDQVKDSDDAKEVARQVAGVCMSQAALATCTAVVGDGMHPARAKEWFLKAAETTFEDMLKRLDGEIASQVAPDAGT